MDVLRCPSVLQYEGLAVEGVLFSFNISEVDVFTWWEVEDRAV